MNRSSLPGSFINPLTGRLVQPGRILGYRRDGRPILVVAGGNGAGGDGGQSGGQGGGNSGAGDGGQGSSGQGGNSSGSGQQGGPSGGQQPGRNGGQGEPQLVEQLPGWAQRVIADLRRENAARRASGNNDGGQGQQSGQGNQGQQGNPGGAQQGQQGNNPTQNDQAIQAAQATARESVVQLAAYRAASPNGADPDLLLDSRTFTDGIKTLDPTAGDFSTKLTAAIKKAVEDNPKLRASQAPGRSGGEFTGRPGGGADKEPTTPGERLRRGYAANQT